MTMNGTLKTVSIVVITLIAVCGVIWGLAIPSVELNHVVTEVAEFQADSVAHKERTTELEKAVIRIQSDYVHIKADLTKILNKLE